MSKLSNIIIHCSDSEFGSAAEIRRWHQGQGWREIGYHFVIPNGLIVPQTSYQTALYLDSLNGSVEVGRKIDGDSFVSDNEVGAHALGYNAKSIGICMIGKDSFTDEQFDTLRSLIHDLMKHYSIAKTQVLGHYQVNPGRTCPGFDVENFKKTL